MRTAFTLFKKKKANFFKVYCELCTNQKLFAVQPGHVLRVIHHEENQTIMLRLCKMFQFSLKTYVNPQKMGDMFCSIGCMYLQCLEYWRQRLTYSGSLYSPSSLSGVVHLAERLQSCTNFWASWILFLTTHLTEARGDVRIFFIWAMPIDINHEIKKMFRLV